MTSHLKNPKNSCVDDMMLVGDLHVANSINL